MLKSTYKPSAAALQPLPPGWTEHKAPTGHLYYYNAETKESTYTRPIIAQPAPPSGFAPQINLSDPNVANAFMAQFNASPTQQGARGGFGGGRGGRGGRGGSESRPKPQPIDKPRSKVPIPGHEPWILVFTKYGRRFAYNPAKNASYWRIPEKLIPAILELDQVRIRTKAAGKDHDDEGDNHEPKEATAAARPKSIPQEEKSQHDYDSSEYEEVEVTDDEDGSGDNGEGSAPKRQRTEEPSANRPVEFTEADIAAQLAAMGADYGDEDMDDVSDHDLDDDNYADDEPLLSDEDARELFKDLLNDFRINPYSPWEKLIEEGKVFDDPRYTVLNTMKARKDVWEEWSRQKITELKDRRAKEEKKDPRMPYIAFLQEKASPKLYWPEFRRKYKKEDPMKDPKLSDKDREKLYREHINRLKLPQSTLKTDLKKLLESIPLAALNNKTMAPHLPPQVLTDIRYISLDPKIRDPFIEAYVQGLGPPPTTEEGEVDDEAAKKAKEERRKREKALQDRERAVAEEKRRQEKKLQFERARLREEERELERAMVVDKKGLQSQLVGDKAGIKEEVS